MLLYYFDGFCHLISGKRIIIVCAGDENKKALLDLDAVDGLLKLVQHEDRIVRRNACMALGVMASYGMYLRLV